MIVQIRYKIDLAYNSILRDGFIEYEESTLQLCDDIDIEDVSIESLIGTSSWSPYSADANLIFDHPEDATIFEQRYPEMIADGQKVAWW